MAIILLFPSARRQRLVQSQARQMASLSPSAAERHLQRQLRTQAEAIGRRGVTAAAVNSDVRALEAAIRIELNRLGINVRGMA